ncbi:MAG: hypothetical protein JWO02_3875 [Solirubrobacterales bacterium]|nr:hypothetical protein [Solirubrobacterales bacterium]
MHSLIHTDFAKATAGARVASGHRPGPDRPQPPPRTVRASTARILAALAGRLDREAARRAVA